MDTSDDVIVEAFDDLGYILEDPKVIEKLKLFCHQYELNVIELSQQYLKFALKNKCDDPNFENLEQFEFEVLKLIIEKEVTSEQPSSVKKVIPKQKDMRDFFSSTSKSQSSKSKTEKNDSVPKYFNCQYCGDKFKHSGALKTHEFNCSRNPFRRQIKKDLEIDNRKTPQEFQNPENVKNEKETEKSSSTQRKPKKTRKAYTNQEKASIIMKFLEAQVDDPNISYKVFAESENIPDKSLVLKWVKQKELILKMAYESCFFKKNRLVAKQNPKHAKTHQLLYSEFLRLRGIGYKISFRWILITGRKLAIKNSLPTFTVKGAQMFLKDKKIRIRQVQRKKQMPKSAHVESLKQWYLKYREDLIKSQWSSAQYDEKWGRFRPSRRFNVDQVPLPFVIDKSTTYESADVGRHDKVWVCHPGAGLDKRQCTLQVAFSAEDNQIKIEIIFRGKKGGKYINPVEKESYHPAVDVFFQDNAWADLNVSLEWIQRTLKPATETSNDEFLLLCDNLGCQVKEEFQTAVRKINGVVYYGLKGKAFTFEDLLEAFSKLQVVVSISLPRLLKAPPSIF